MKKRVKLIAVVSSFCLCLSLFVMGIFAATSVTFNVTSSISFKADGVFVKVSAQLRQGPTAGDAIRQSGTPDTYQYTGYSYSRESGSDLPDGSATLDNFVNESGVPDSTWEIGEIQFTDELPVVVYHFTFTNYSPMPVQVSVTSNIQTLKTEMTGILDITEAYSNGTIMEGYTTDSSQSSTVYTITVELEKFTDSFELKPLGLTINFTTEIPDENDYPTLTFTSNGDRTASVKKNSLNLPTGDLVIPSMVLVDGELCDVTGIGYNAFYGCSALTGITIPNSVTSIGDSAFLSCSALKSITIPNSVTSIGNGAFENCSSLTSITIPDSVTSIGSSAFSFCSKLTSIEIPDSVTSIGNGAFAHCSKLTSITISKGVTSIGGSAFYGCSSLTGITIPEGVTSIGNYAFYNCSSLSSITIPDSVTSIGRYAFQDCSELTSITIPSSVTSIGSSAFWYCTKLTNVTIESDYAYSNATSTTACGRLLQNATTVRVLTSCIGTSTNSYLDNTNNFTKSIQGDYTVYTKKVN